MKWQSLKIPPELLESIVAYHSNDPSTLLILSTASRDLRTAAESVLYKDVCIMPKSQDSSKGLSFLRTLQRSPEKVCLVRSFVFQFKEAHDHHQELCRLLCAVLPKMSGLKTLSIEASDNYDGNLILAALRKSTFSLNYFSSSHHLNLAIWALDHPSLIAVAVEGLQAGGYRPDDMDLFRDLASSSRCRGPLAVFTYCRHPMEDINLAVFPVFSPIVNGVTSWNADPIQKFYTTWSVRAPSSPHSLGIFVESLSDQMSMSKILSSVAHNFPELSLIGFFIRDHRIDLNPEGLSIALGAVTKLQRMGFMFGFGLPRGSTSTTGAYQTEKKRLAGLWAQGSPNLMGISFPDDALYLRDNDEWGEFKICRII